MRILLERRAAGEELSVSEQEGLVRDARVLQRKVARLRALDPDAFGGLELSAEIEALAGAPALTASA